MPFASLGFSPELLPFLARAMDEAGYAAPTAVQAQAIPAILQGRDVLGCAPTGSGKTAAFALPLLQHAAQRAAPPDGQVRALVLVPTRELAAQASDTLAALARHLPRRIKVVALAGGVSINPQLMQLRGGADLVVATPGRLLDAIAHNALGLGGVATLVLDEADRLLELGFADELGQILARLPPQRQTLLFSATFPAPVERLARRLLREPLRVDVAAGAGAETEAAPAIRQRAIEVDPAQRTQLLRHLLHSEAWPQALVFVASQRAAENVAEKLRKAGLAAQPLHGELSQGRRRQTLDAFKAGQLQVLVATDLAARGIDIARLPVVVNYDLPRATVDYTHRIGRTARAGAAGMAVSFVGADAQAHLRLIEKRERLRVPRERIAGFEPTQAPAANPADPQGNGGIKGKRPSKKDKLRAANAQGGGAPGGQG
ncbi:DEAD/DEAH box helicase [Xanthomonas sp. AM6]|uniref:DEAD/DEAH box helicase n=1 Tax=Xanthomonas sp. AM6 TaxID=2982531 RepID=UPI0021DA655E|nr:DEAD/DEAH box helicase [Xanthomonas sp. AM6]UYB52049.1 DEAD/DEAH box helicase [Xanthomonas sp. AM6]